jgi:hypothetical protein
MFIVLVFLLTSFNSYAQLSYGDGSEICNWESTTNMTQRIYNCESVTVSLGQTITFSGASDYIIIRSQGDVNILGTLELSANGVTPGPGGTASGVVQNGGEGLSGNLATDGGGGGGSGARFGTSTLPTAGSNGTGTTPGIGAIIPGTSYFPENDFENNFTGGAGGGTGGNGFDTSDAEIGGTGGGGAGGVIIIAKGQVTISGSILANGGNGVNGAATGTGMSGAGGGGAGSGGAVYIIGNQVNITGTISANGGTGGNGGSLVDDGGAGGNGGSGRIRVDSLASTYTGVATSPTAFQTSLPTIIDPLALPEQQLSSDIEYSCVYKEAQSFNFYLNFLMGLALVALLQIPKGFRYLR